MHDACQVGLAFADHVYAHFARACGAGFIQWVAGACSVTSSEAPCPRARLRTPGSSRRGSTRQRLSKSDGPVGSGRGVRRCVPTAMHFGLATARSVRGRFHFATYAASPDGGASDPRDCIDAAPSERSACGRAFRTRPPRSASRATAAAGWRAAGAPLRLTGAVPHGSSPRQEAISRSCSDSDAAEPGGCLGAANGKARPIR